MPRPSIAHTVLLSSITSIGLRKITFRVTYTFHWRPTPEGRDRWNWVDEQLCGLVDRLGAMGYRRTLEAELRFDKITGGPGKHGFTNVLPEFKEKGVVTFIDTSREDQVIYSSAHNN